MTRKLAIVIGVVITTMIFCPAASAGTDLPDFGDSAGQVISPTEERELGQDFFREIRKHVAIVDDPEIEDYINALGQRLAAHSHDYSGKFTFFMVDNPAINAFAVPGGYVGVHSGLILNSRSESEVAAVLAHEIVHVTQRHGARAIEAAGKLSMPTMAAMAGAILLATVNPQAGQAAMATVSALGTQYRINFTRSNEQEADRIGIELLASAGFDPHSMPAFFERLQQVNRYNDPAHVPEFLRTHPVTVSRIAESRSRAERLAVKISDPDPLPYKLTWAKLKVASIDDPITAVRLYQSALRNGDFEHEQVARYGYVLALSKAGNYPSARLQLRHLLDAAPREQAYLLAAAHLEYQAGDLKQASVYYQNTLAIDPKSRAAILGYSRVLLQAQQAARAKRLLRDYLYNHRSSPRFYKLLGEAESQLGNMPEARLALAEFYHLSGETDLAIDQLRIALESTRLTHIQRQRIEARELELAQIQAAAKKSKKRF